METYLLGFIDSIPKNYLPYLFLIGIIASIVAIVACVLSFLVVKRLKAQKNAIEEVQVSLDCAKETNKELNDKCQGLLKYECIFHAEREANRLLENSKKEVSEATRQANDLVLAAKQEADTLANKAREEIYSATSEASSIVSTAKSDANSIRNKAKQELTIATEKANEIIDEAKNKAQEIAGEAYSIKESVDSYERALRALKNQIEGYGDAYVYPAQGLLDELADDFGFDEAGVSLKVARTHTQNLIKEGLAGTCDYVETVRKVTAIRFVISAFNGRVDTILSTAQHDNYGTLAEKIKDAFFTVNHNGKAFRNARITDAFLAARLEELKCATIVFALREKAREEQRAIRERIREEEKARREFERSLKQAQKDESQIRTAMEKARSEVEKANVAERAKYEERLAVLEAKLAEAEAREQRAISMAQMTRSGHVYVISNVGSFGPDVLKIGMTRRLEPMDRVKELGDASVPFPFDVHAMIYCEDAPLVENVLHKKFNELRMNKVNSRKEFFRVPLPDIRNELEGLGIKAAFTLTAQALEYRESLSVDSMSVEERSRLLGRLLLDDAPSLSAMEDDDE